MSPFPSSSSFPSSNARSLPGFPEFVQGVRYGVLGTHGVPGTPQATGGLGGPRLGAVETIPSEREPNRRDFGCGHWGVDEIQPFGPAGGVPGSPHFGTVRSRQRRTGSEIIFFQEGGIIHGDSNRRTTKRSPHHGTRPVRKQDRDYRTGATGGSGRRRLLGPPSVRDAIASLSARIPGLLALRTTECAHVG